MTTVRQYKEETKCAHCGRFIRNVVEIDGVQYGTRCCEAFLPRHASIAKNGVVMIDVQKIIAQAEEMIGAELVKRYCCWTIEALETYAAREYAKNAAAVKLVIEWKNATR